jgi:hypothetical protein
MENTEVELEMKYIPQFTYLNMRIRLDVFFRKRDDENNALLIFNTRNIFYQMYPKYNETKSQLFKNPQLSNVSLTCITEKEPEILTVYSEEELQNYLRKIEKKLSNTMKILKEFQEWCRYYVPLGEIKTVHLSDKCSVREHTTSKTNIKEFVNCLDNKDKKKSLKSGIIKKFKDMFNCDEKINLQNAECCDIMNLSYELIKSYSDILVYMLILLDKYPHYINDDNMLFKLEDNMMTCEQHGDEKKIKICHKDCLNSYIERTTGGGKKIIEGTHIIFIKKEPERLRVQFEDMQ